MAEWEYSYSASYGPAGGLMSSSDQGGTISTHEGEDYFDPDSPESYAPGQFAGYTESSEHGTILSFYTGWFGEQTFYFEEVPEGFTPIQDLRDPEGTGHRDSTIYNYGVEPEKFAVCFAEGTLIETPDGKLPVESLKEGDLVCTADGRQVPVVWMGRQTLHKLFTPGERFCPVRVRAGALAPGLPERDLVVTPDHALMIDGLAINAGALVNGRSIVRVARDELPQRVTYWHIETEDHDVVLAEGAAAETFVDNVSRRRFDNYADYEARFGEEIRRIEQSPAPRVMSRRQLPERIRVELERRADAIGRMTEAA